LNKISLEVIALLASTVDNASYQIRDEAPTGMDLQAWPKLTEDDVVIQTLMNKTVALNESSLDAHKSVICAVQLNDDLSMLPMCIDSYDMMFLRQSLGLPYSPTFTPNEYQLAFIDSALRHQAAIAEGPAISHSYLDEVVSLGRSWGLMKSQILTQFFLVMYEYAKDEMVDDLVNSSTRLIDVAKFMDEGIPIVCVRLYAAISTLKRAKQCRSILAMLDADTCEWVKEQADTTIKENPDIIITDEDGRLMSLDNTYALILRMRRMSSVNRIDAYALGIMCETLLKAMEQYDG
jgi:hypothetical protein